MKKITLLLILLMISIVCVKAQWTDNPAINTQISQLMTEQTIPKIAVGPDGDYYIGFFSSESGNYNVRLQRLDFNGNTQWQTNGILVSAHPSMSWLTDWDMAVDHENHAILTWQDIRSGGNNNVVAYRISPSGDFNWGPDGIMLSNSTNFDVSPKLTVTAANNSVFAWQSEENIIMQKMAPDGTKLWGENGITVSGTNNLSWPQLMPVGDDEVIMKYFNDEGPPHAPTRHILAQRYDAGGSPVWAESTVITNAGGISAWTQILPMVNDGNDGFFIAWHEDRNFTNLWHPYAQYVNAEGVVQFGNNGVLLATDSHMNHLYPLIAKPANDDHVYVYWNKLTGNQNNWGLFGQKLSPDGNKLWPDIGKQIIPVSSSYVLPLQAVSLEQEMVVLYEGSQNVLYAKRLKSNGEPAWEEDPVSVSTHNSTKIHLDAAALFNNQMVFAWGDNRSGNGDIYAQNLHSNGSLGMIEAPGFISGVLNFDVPGADPQLAVVSANGHEIHPDADGAYSLEMEAGTYTLTATHPFTETFVQEDVVVEPGMTTEVDIELLMLRTDVFVSAEDQFGNLLAPVSFTINGPEDTYTGTIEHDYAVIEEVPYGAYFGIAEFMDYEITSDTLIYDENQNLVFSFLTVGHEERKIPAHFVIHPNPVEAGGQLSIQSNMQGTVSIRILDVNGKTLVPTHQHDWVIGQNKLSLNQLTAGKALTAGVYVLQIHNEISGWFQHKFLIK